MAFELLFALALALAEEDAGSTSHQIQRAHSTR